MCKESYEAIDEGSLSLGLIRLAIPIALSGMLQQLFNSVDVAVIGRFAGGLALAAVGANAANVSLFVMLLTGLSVGPNVLIARLIGAKEKEEISESVHTAILFSILFGLGIMVGGQLLSEALMDWMHTPGEIADGAILYFRIYLLGLPFIALYNFCASILRCIGDSKRPLYTLFASGILNVLLNLVFVVAFHMDVAGVVTATALSNVFSAFVLLGILMREQGAIRLDVTKLRLKMQYVGEIVKIGLPSGIQGMLFSLSNLFIQSTLNGYGASAIAGSSTALTFEYITYNIALAFSQACVTFLSRSYGAGAHLPPIVVVWFPVYKRGFSVVCLEGFDVRRIVYCGYGDHRLCCDSYAICRSVGRPECVPRKRERRHACNRGVHTTCSADRHRLCLFPHPVGTVCPSAQSDVSDADAGLSGFMDRYGCGYAARMS